MQNHISFLHEELIKLPAFPRKALDAEFSLYQGSLGNVSTTSKLHVIWADMKVSRKLRAWM